METVVLFQKNHVNLIEETRGSQANRVFRPSRRNGQLHARCGRIGIVQTRLSRNVRWLEFELHQTFLLRNVRGVTLTEAVRVLLKASIRS